MAECAALLVDDVLPHQARRSCASLRPRQWCIHVRLRQWVLSLPYALRFLCAREPAVMGQVLSIAYRAIATHLIGKAGRTHKTAETGAVTLMLCMDARMPRAHAVARPA